LFFARITIVRKPILSLYNCAYTRDLSEDLITDNAIHSDLDPLEAPEWSVSVTLLDRPDCLLAKHLDSFLLLCSDTRTVKQLLGDMEEEAELAHSELNRLPGVLDRLAGPPVLPSVSLSDLASRVRPLRGHTPTGGPLKPELLKTVLGYIFPDAGQGPSHPPYPPGLASNNSSVGGCADVGPDLLAGGGGCQLGADITLARQLYGSAKTGPADGLLWRLATAFACCLSWGGAAGAAHLLQELCLEVRYRWESGRPLPGLGPGCAPDTATALLHQKLQMINCCIARRNSYIKASRLEEAEDDENAGHDSDTDYEEFFDAEDEEENGTDRKGGLAPWEKAECREERVGQLRLLSGLDWMYRPALQEPAPLTEDQLAEQVSAWLLIFFLLPFSINVP
jgi:Rab3 GTPase-activating protein catalytic subunit